MRVFEDTVVFFQIYWCGPLLGGTAASLLYDNVFAANASALKTKAYLLARNYHPGEYYESTEISLHSKVDEAEACL